MRKTLSIPLLALFLALVAAGAAHAQGGEPPPAAAGAGDPASSPAAKGDPESETPAGTQPGGAVTGTADEPALPSFFATTTVTATGQERDAFEVTTPVTVISAQTIAREQPDSAADLLRAQPGVDVNGVGPNQARPIIRGQRGLRVLFLENGLRLNNARRQTDFGEIVGLVDVDAVDRVEVVRGPASVLYGSDAIGGVINLITRVPSFRAGAPLRGTLGLRAGSADGQRRAQAAVDGRYERLSFNLGASFRDADDYDAAAGTFGDIDLARDTPVVDTGLRDDSFWAYFDVEAAERHRLSLRIHRYRAGETGFGFVEPELLGEDDDFRIRILYPFQDFDRYTLGWFGTAFESVLADSVEAQLYFQSNERQLANDIDINIGPLFRGAPDSTVEADTLNFTDLDTLGARLEAVKVVGDRHVLTWGGEFFEDDSFNTDRSTTTTTLRFPFPPFEVVDVATDIVANAPNATNRSLGLFVQDEIAAGDRLGVTLGGRWQRVETRAESTPGWDTSGLDFSDTSAVGALNLLYRVTDNVHLVGSLASAFRAPNIIERLFNGPTPEGAGFQLLNPDLTSEESLSFDAGLKYRRQNAYFEAVYFETEIRDGIIQDFLSPAEVDALPPAVRQAIADSGATFVVQQRNVDELRYEGVEAVIGYRAPCGFSTGGNYTHLTAKRTGQSAAPVENHFSDKYNLYARWEPPSGRYWLEYRLRRNGDERARLDPEEPIPAIGDTLPAFTIHTLAGGVTLFERGAQRHELTLIVENLSDELYAEFSNATFFRPEPGRNLIASYRVTF